MSGIVWGQRHRRIYITGSGALLGGLTSALLRHKSFKGAAAMSRRRQEFAQFHPVSEISRPVWPKLAFSLWRADQILAVRFFFIGS